MNRKRDKAITIRLTETEYQDLQNRVTEAGISQQAFVINAIKGAVIPSADELLLLKETSKTFADLTRQLRGLSTNVNQMAHIANAWGAISTESELRSISDQINDYRIESEKAWQSIRSSINQPRATGL